MARVVYIAALRAIISYGVGIWARDISKGDLSTLKVLQNKALRIVLGAFKSTPISLLEREAFIPPLDLYIRARLIKFNYLALKNDSFRVFLENTTKDLAGYLKKDFNSPIKEKERYLLKALEINNLNLLENPNKYLKKDLLKKWEERQLPKYISPNIFTPPPTKKALYLFKNLERNRGTLLI